MYIYKEAYITLYFYTGVLNFDFINGYNFLFLLQGD